MTIEMDPLKFDRSFRKEGRALICGVDEAGRGPLAGPVVAAAVIMPKGRRIVGVDDSKKVPEALRYKLRDKILKRCVSHGLAVVDAETIDRINILQATLLAMREAVMKMDAAPHMVLVDGNRRPRLDFPMETVVKGDQRSYCIAAASIIAKCHRDELMLDLDRRYPQYGFAAHKGYGTARHLEALFAHGPIDGEHRTGFEPVRRAIEMNASL